MVRWDIIDTVLLDMDGTLLDLCYDNALWNTLVPERYSEANNITLDSARTELFSHMSDKKGHLEFYCLNYWAEYTGLDIHALHHELADLIGYRPYAQDFLHWLRGSGKRSLLVTNAHRHSLMVKDQHSGLTELLDVTVSCHDYGAPKESQEFWQRLMNDHPFDPQRTLLIDDNDQVLGSAARYGIAHLLTVSQPDSERPAREALNYPALRDFRDLRYAAEQAGSADNE